MFEMILKGVWVEDFEELSEADDEIICRQQYRDIPVEQELIFD